MNNEDNDFVGGHVESFKDPAMNTWVTLNSLNSTCETLREVNDRINNKISIVSSTLIGIFSTYFLSIRNWIAVLILLILLEIIVFYQIRKQLKHRKELYIIKSQIVNKCKEKGIKLPKNA